MKDFEVRIGMLVDTPSGGARVNHRDYRSDHKQWWSLRIVQSGLEAYYTADHMVELPLTHREHERLHATSARRHMVDTNLVTSQVDSMSIRSTAGRSELTINWQDHTVGEYVSSVSHREQMQRDQEAFEIVVREAADLRRRLEETSNACNDALNHVEELQGECDGLARRLEEAQQTSVRIVDGQGILAFVNKDLYDKAIEDAACLQVDAAFMADWLNHNLIFEQRKNSITRILVGRDATWSDSMRTVVNKRKART